METQKGNIKLAILIALVLLATATAFGWLFGKQSSSTKPQNVTTLENQQSVAVMDETAEWKTYKNEKNSYQLDYPSKYRIEENTETNQTFFFSDTADIVFALTTNVNIPNVSNDCAQPVTIFTVASQDVNFCKNKDGGLWGTILKNEQVKVGMVVSVEGEIPRETQINALKELLSGFQWIN